jgi:hypothetical protein
MGLGATIDRFEEGVGILRLDDGQELDVPMSELPPGLHEGSRLNLSFIHTADDEIKKAEQARKLLNDLLQSNS